MRSVNPFVIPRNHKVEEALSAASVGGDLKPLKKLLAVLKKPYDIQKKIDEYLLPPTSDEKSYKTFCGT